MSNRFSHIKNRSKDIERFIEGANKSKQKESAQFQNKEQKHVLLSISSRMNRDEECKKPTLLYIKRDIISDIEKHCHGNKQAILNYLLRQGLDTVIKNGKLILI